MARDTHQTRAPTGRRHPSLRRACVSAWVALSFALCLQLNVPFQSTLLAPVPLSGEVPASAFAPTGGAAVVGRADDGLLDQSEVAEYKQFQAFKRLLKLTGGGLEGQQAATRRPSLDPSPTPAPRPIVPEHLGNPQYIYQEAVTGSGAPTDARRACVLVGGNLRVSTRACVCAHSPCPPMSVPVCVCPPVSLLSSSLQLPVEAVPDDR